MKVYDFYTIVMKKSVKKVFIDHLNVDQIDDELFLKLLFKEIRSKQKSLSSKKYIIAHSRHWFRYCCMYAQSREEILERYFKGIMECSIDHMMLINYSCVKFKPKLSVFTIASLCKREDRMGSFSMMERYNSLKLRQEKNFSFLKDIPSEVAFKGEVFQVEVPQKGSDFEEIGKQLQICTGAACHFKRVRIDKNQFRITLFKNGVIHSTMCFNVREFSVYALEFKHKDMAPTKLKEILKQIKAPVASMKKYKSMSYDDCKNYHLSRR